MTILSLEMSCDIYNSFALIFPLADRIQWICCAYERVTVRLRVNWEIHEPYFVSVAYSLPNPSSNLKHQTLQSFLFQSGLNAVCDFGIDDVGTEFRLFLPLFFDSSWYAMPKMSVPSKIVLLIRIFQFYFIMHDLKVCDFKRGAVANEKQQRWWSKASWQITLHVKTVELALSHELGTLFGPYSRSNEHEFVRDKTDEETSIITIFQLSHRKMTKSRRSLRVSLSATERRWRQLTCSFFVMINLFP